MLEQQDLHVLLMGFHARSESCLLLLEDWLECQTSRCASPECQRSESFLRGSSSSPPVILRRIAHKLFVSHRLFRSRTIAISLKRPNKLFQSQKLKVPHLSFSTNPPASRGPSKRSNLDDLLMLVCCIAMLNVIACYL